MPGPLVKRHKLGDQTGARNKQMSGYLDVSDGGEVRMLLGVQLINEKGFHTAGTKLAGRQADVMDNQQADSHICRALIEVGRGAMPHALQPAIEDSVCQKEVRLLFSEGDMIHGRVRKRLPRSEWHPPKRLDRSGGQGEYQLAGRP